MRAGSQTGIERESTMSKEAYLANGNDRPEEGVTLTFFQNRPLQEWDHFVQNRDVASDPNIMCNGIREPGPIIADARANAAIRFRQPPVLNIAFHELPRCCAQ